MARFQSAEQVARKEKEAAKSRIWKEVAATVPAEQQWYEYMQRISCL